MRDRRFQSTLISWRLSKKWRYGARSASGLFIILIGVFFAIPRIYADQSIKKAPSVTGSDWPTYMYDIGRSGYNQAETIINQQSAPNLKLHWTIQSGGKIFSQPVVANGMVYWGSFDGYEHAANLTGQQLWQQNLGRLPPAFPIIRSAW